MELLQLDTRDAAIRLGQKQYTIQAYFGHTYIAALLA